MTDPNYKLAAWELRCRAAAATSLPVAAPSNGADAGNRFTFTPEQHAQFAEERTRLREKLSVTHAQP